MSARLIKQSFGSTFYLGIFGTEEEIQAHVNWFYNIKATDAKHPIDSTGNFGYISLNKKTFIRQLAWSWHSKAMEHVSSERFSRQRRTRIAWIKALKTAIQFYREIDEEIVVKLNYLSPWITPFKSPEFSHTKIPIYDSHPNR